MSSIGEYTATNASLEAALVPSSEVAKEYMNPVQDDTWVRHAELIKIEDLKDTEVANDVKDEILQDYQANKKDQSMDPVLKKMIDEEKFINEYKCSHSRQDKVKAMSYKESMMQKYRTKKA